MPDYGLVSRAINHVTDRIEREGERRRAHELSMTDLGFQGANIDLQDRRIRGQQQLQVAKAKRDQFMNEVVTGRQAIMTHPGLSDQQKQAFLQKVPKDMLDGMAFKRSEWANGLRGAMQERRKANALAQYRKDQLGLEKARNRIAMTGRQKDSRTPLQKNVDTIAEIFGIDRQEAYKKYRNDEALAEKIRLYNNERDALEKNLDFQDLKPDEQAAKIDQLRSDFLGDFIKKKAPKKQKISLPGNIKKTSDAVVYLKDQGLTEDQAVEWLRSYMTE